MKQERKELMELAHEPVPGYKTALYITITIGILYLGLIFLFSLK